MQFSVTQKFVRTTPRKLRLVADMIRGLPANEVIEMLPFVEKRAAGPIAKVVKAALAAAKEKGESPEGIILKEVQIGEGPRLKRWRAGARGRAKPYAKRMSHVRIVLEKREKSEPQRQVRATQGTKSVRGDKSGIKSLPNLSKEKKKGSKK